MAKKLKKKKLSGQQYKKLRVQKALKGEMMRFHQKHEPRCHEDFLALLGRVTKAFANGDIPDWFASRIAYLCQVGGQLTNQAETLRELRAMQQQLAQINGQPLLPNGRQVLDATGDES